MSQAEFPTTHATWIAAQLSRGEAGRTEVHDHVMRRYAAPLRAYVLGSTLRTLDDADALVNGFFVSRLSRGDYLGKWQESALPLRRWLVNGLLLHARERLREQRRASGVCEGCACTRSARSCSRSMVPAAR